jgi:formylglycine-generating enzyme required for sulfatase activity
LAEVGTLEQQQAFRKELEKQGITINEPKMIFVEGGTFWMGSTEEQGDDCFDDKRLFSKVTLKGFKIGKYPVTQAQWVRIMGSNPAANAQGGDYPVENVSWYEAQEFCERLNVATGGNYRLPTEAEWRYAARGGNKSQQKKYSGANDFKELKEVTWRMRNSDRHTHPVGKKEPNELGLYDMSGNVWEWCSNWYSDYPATPQENPQGPLQDSIRVLLGGSWVGDAKNCRVSNRDDIAPGFRSICVGFRLVSP